MEDNTFDNEALQESGASEEIKEKKVKKVKKDREYIGIFTAKFMQCASYGPHVIDKHIKPWSRGDMVRSKAEIDALLALKAPLEVWYRDRIYGTAKS